MDKSLDRGKKTSDFAQKSQSESIGNINSFITFYYYDFIFFWHTNFLSNGLGFSLFSNLLLFRCLFIKTILKNEFIEIFLLENVSLTLCYPYFYPKMFLSKLTPFAILMQ